jgi:hypothetical protein
MSAHGGDPRLLLHGCRAAGARPAHALGAAGVAASSTQAALLGLRCSRQAQAVGRAPAARADVYCDVYCDKLLHNSLLRDAAGREGAVMGPASASLPQVVVKLPHSGQASDAAVLARARSAPASVCQALLRPAACSSGHQERWGSASAGEHLLVVGAGRLALPARLGQGDARQRILRRSGHPASARGPAGAREAWHDMLLLQSPQVCARRPRPARARHRA